MTDDAFLKSTDPLRPGAVPSSRERERERQRERQRASESKRERARASKREIKRERERETKTETERESKREREGITTHLLQLIRGELRYGRLYGKRGRSDKANV